MVIIPVCHTGDEGSIPFYPSIWVIGVMVTQRTFNPSECRFKSCITHHMYLWCNGKHNGLLNRAMQVRIPPGMPVTGSLMVKHQIVALDDVDSTSILPPMNINF